MIGGLAAFYADLLDDFDSWIATPLSLAVAWPNKAFTKPDPPANWLRFTLLNGDSEQTAMATPKRFRHAGSLIVNVFVRPNYGVAAALAIADQIADRYRCVERAGAQFRAPSVVSQGLVDDAWSVVVRCPFYADRLI